jgi:cob(I)alamin adenosyltransferase
MLKKGLIQIYTGTGKGKTSAAIGLAVRAAGHGNSVLIYQFLKPPDLQTGERFAFKDANLDITIKPLDIKWDMKKSLGDPDVLEKTKAEISRLMEEIGKAAVEGDYDIIILDEILFCYSNRLVSYDDLKKLAERKSGQVELVFTGRGADNKLINLADQVSEIKNIKHPYENGINARKGIDF